MPPKKTLIKKKERKILKKKVKCDSQIVDAKESQEILVQNFKA